MKLLPKSKKSLERKRPDKKLSKKKRMNMEKLKKSRI
jgi:hypothetical protein